MSDEPHTNAENETGTARVEGSGAIAQGSGAVAAGEGGVAVGRDVYGGVHIGDKVYTRSQVEALHDYLGKAAAAYEARMYQLVARPPAPPDQPYKFLYAFEIEDAHIFFGRNAATQSVYQTVLKDRLTVLHAKSGAGKTSLLNAGLSPLLIREGRLPVYVRAYDDPVRAIKRAVAPPSLGPWPELLEKLTLQEFLGLACDHLGHKTQELVIILDQFEAFFVIWPEKDSRQPFIEALADGYDDKSLRTRYVIGIRGDYFTNLATAQSRLPHIFHNEYFLETMTREEAQAAVTEPVTRLSRTVMYEQALLDIVLDDLARGGMSLPHLQIICSRLYEALPEDKATITLVSYDEMGRAEGVLGDYLNDVLSRLPGQGEMIARQILEELVSVEATKLVLSFEELAARVAAPEADVANVLTQLVDSRLLRRDEIAGHATYEMAHEYLIGEITLSPEVIARKEAEELLRQAVENWERHNALPSTDALAVIDKQRDRLHLDPDAQELMLRSALRHGAAVGYWLTRVEDEHRALALAGEALLAPQGKPARQSLSVTADDLKKRQPERLYALVAWLESCWRKARGVERAWAADALWALRSHLSRRLRLRLALGRSPRLMRRIALLLVGALIAAAVIALLQWGRRIWTPKPNIDWVDIPAGEFLMGSDPMVDPHALDVEMPQHKVYLDAYRISKYEITNDQYRQCVSAEVCDEPAGVKFYSDPEYGNDPVVYVSWFNAKTFCEWVGGRLPTEAEWEYAARGPDGHLYPWGDEFDCSRGNFEGEECDGYVGTAPVGSFSDGSSWSGAHDLAGNVWEWVADWFDDYPSEAETNPTGPDQGDSRVLRGGSWDLIQEYARSAYRLIRNPDDRYSYIGFRCGNLSMSSP